MDVPGPKCNSTVLQEGSLAHQEGLCQSDDRAPFRDVVIRSGGPSVPAGTPTTKETQQRGLTAQSGGVGTCRIRKNTSARLLSIETFVVQICAATPASRSLLDARPQNRVTGRTIRVEL
jgi:hypothetical protein